MKTIEELRAIANYATPGPWSHSPEMYDRWRPIRSADGTIIANVHEKTANAAHIATFSPPTILALLARLEAAEAEASDLRGALYEANGTIDRLFGLVESRAKREDIMRRVRGLTEEATHKESLTVARARIVTAAHAWRDAMGKHDGTDALTELFAALQADTERGV